MPQPGRRLFSHCHRGGLEQPPLRHRLNRLLRAQDREPGVGEQVTGEHHLVRSVLTEQVVALPGQDDNLPPRRAAPKRTWAPTSTTGRPSCRSADPPVAQAGHAHVLSI
ncbi:hypothetical protein [Streptomyces sp. NPDC059278]|uniref:hypothetical protein n=1 Tax=Streptomyces sp. NPDC059278 TaxID=3346801 RepID=UPI0036B16083